LAGEAAAAASAGKIACYNLVQFTQAWFRQMHLNDADFTAEDEQKNRSDHGCEATSLQSVGISSNGPLRGAAASILSSLAGINAKSVNLV
jgi:hypothetical protein